MRQQMNGRDEKLIVHGMLVEVYAELRTVGMIEEALYYKLIKALDKMYGTKQIDVSEIAA